MFDKIKQALVMLQEAPPVDFTGSILFGVVGTIVLIGLVVAVIIYYSGRSKDKVVNNHTLWNVVESV